MHRFYLPPESCRGESLRLEGREAHHALQVLRLKRGERVTVLDGAPVGSGKPGALFKRMHAAFVDYTRELAGTPPL